MLSAFAVVVGSFLMALAVNLFFVPLKLAEGGVTGVGIILLHTLGIPVWVTILGLNIPIVALGVKYKGWGFLKKTLLGVGSFSGFLALTEGMTPVTDQAILAVVYGGLLMGIGLGIVLRFGGTTGGTDILAIVGQMKFGISVGNMVMIVDLMVLTAAGFAFGFEAAMWAAITLMISSRVVDLVNEGAYAAKGITIITTEPKAIAEQILHEVERGCTILKGIGAYTGEPREVLYVVAQRGELAQIKQIAHQHDPKAFVVVSNVHEVLGEGFRSRSD